MSGIRPPDCSKLAKNPKNDNDVTVFRHDLNVKSCFVSLVKFSYWSKFHVNIITGSGIMTIFFYNGLTRNPEIGNTPIWVLPNIWRLRRVSDTKFGSDEMLPNAAKFQVYSFYRFWVIKGKPTGQGGNCPPHPTTTTTTQIRVNKVADLRPEILCKKRLRPRSFSVNFAVFLRTSFIQNTSGRLHLTMYII